MDDVTGFTVSLYGVDYEHAEDADAVLLAWEEMTRDLGVAD